MNLRIAPWALGHLAAGHLLNPVAEHVVGARVGQRNLVPGCRDRTGTRSPPRDFKSLVSTYFTTRATKANMPASSRNINLPNEAAAASFNEARAFSAVKSSGARIRRRIQFRLQ